MNEAEWLASEDPAAMLEHLCERPKSAMPGPFHGQRISVRRLRLFACGCCRLCWDRLTDPRSRLAVGVAERFADGALVSQQEWVEAAGAFDREDVVRRSAWSTGIKDARQAAFQASGELRHVAPPAAQAALLRCVAGNPWRPVVRVDRWLSGPLPAVSPAGFLRPEHLTPTALALATAAYAERRPCGWCDGSGKWKDKNTGTTGGCSYCHGAGTDGLLAPDRLAVLADALGDAGCDSEELLGHLRSPGPHARGCWALDCVLGRS